MEPASSTEVDPPVSTIVMSGVSSSREVTEIVSLRIGSKRSSDRSSSTEMTMSTVWSPSATFSSTPRTSMI